MKWVARPRNLKRIPFQHGETTLSRYQYQQVFANFLLCRTKVGPGHLIYGPMDDPDILDRIQASLNIT